MWLWLAIAICVVGGAWAYLRLRALRLRALRAGGESSCGRERQGAPTQTYNRYGLAEEAAGFGVWEVEIGDDTALLSAGAALLYGFPPVEARVLVTQLTSLIHPEDRAATLLANQGAIEDRSGYEVEFRVRTSDGSYRWRQSRARLKCVGDRPKRMVGAVIDITKEKEMLERLTEGAERLKLAEQAAGFGISEWDPASQLLTLSSGAAAISGLGSESLQLTSQEAYSSVHPADRDIPRVAREGAMAEGGLYEAEYRRVFPDGSVRWYRNRGFVEPGGNRSKRVIGTVIDITKE
jgi:PAS domain S-box-containing protein